MKRKLREGGRIMVNVGGSCVEPEDGWEGDHVGDVEGDGDGVSG